jgi:hypothetical protein
MANETTVPTIVMQPGITLPRREQPDKQTSEEKSVLAAIAQVGKLKPTPEIVAATHALMRAKDLVSEAADRQIAEEARKKNQEAADALREKTKDAQVPGGPVLPKK